jgi:hypothetical protein
MADTNYERMFQMIWKIRLMMLMTVFLIPGVIYASDYTHQLETDEMTVSWTLDGDQVHMAVSAKTTGWVSIGIDPEDAMGGADIIIGMVREGQIEIQDHYADRKRGHSPDEKLGGSNHVMNPDGQEKDGVTTITFTRSVNTVEQWDKSIQTTGTTRVMIAYGSGRDSFAAGHRFRAVYDIDFSTGDAVQIK